MNLFRIVFPLLIFSAALDSPAQVIRGTVFESETRATLPGATIRVFQDTLLISASTSNETGQFSTGNLQAGKYRIIVSFIGFKSYSGNGITVSSGRETYLEIPLEPSLNQLEAVEIKATERDRGDEMALVSNRSFIVEETERYAGSRGDPARMASNYAGVQSSDDSRNDIVVRGNSPAGVLYRFEGIDIPNPNHFAVAGTMGGPVSIINNKVLANSEFYMGAFPAQYGNATAAVFDLKMRNGNEKQAAFSGQFGFLGTELTAEGPLGKSGKTSVLANFRYSTLKLFEAVNFQIGTSAVPAYRDAAFKINHRIKDGSVSLFGMGGKSSVDIVVSEIENPEDEIYGDKNRDQYFRTAMGVLGASFSKTTGKKSFLKIVAAGSANQARTNHDFVVWDTTGTVSSIFPILAYNFTEKRGHLNFFHTLRAGGRTVIKTGILNTAIGVNYTDSLMNLNNGYFITRLGAKDVNFLFQPFMVVKYSLNESTEFTGGLHGMWFSLNNSSSIEPRIGLRKSISRKHVLAFGAGMHSQLLPVYLYYHEQFGPQHIVRHNRNSGPVRAIHSVLAHEYIPGSAFRFRTELFAQYLYQVPVTVMPSSFSMLNAGTGFSRIFPDSLENTGEGKNAGIEFTAERYFNRSFYMLATLSLYSSIYRGSDNKWRSTDFNGNYISSFLAGKEFSVSEKNTLQFGIRINYSGGRRYGPVNIPASAIKGETVYVDSTANSLQFDPYFRTDVKLVYRINRKRTGHEFGLDLVNVFNTKNLLALSYIPDPTRPSANPIREEYQLGFLPLFYYRVDWIGNRNP